MQTKFKDIAQYYLGTGLEIEILNYKCDYAGIKTAELVGFYLIGEERFFTYKGGWTGKSTQEIKPLLRSLDSLTKPIIVKGYNDGKEFVPIEEIKIQYPNTPNCGYILGFNYYNLSETIVEWCVMVLLLKWHFNVFGLEETEYIKID